MTRILLVEDHAAMQMMIKELLEFGGHCVEATRTGEEALNVLKRKNPLPDVIISDLTMPQMDGLTLFASMRQNPRWDDVRFVLMSGNLQDDRLQTELILHLDGVLPKPFSLADLNAVIE
jgi:CheY-like chemotaxis protein